MDPNIAYQEMAAFMRDAQLDIWNRQENYTLAREKAVALTEWFDKGGFTPYQYQKKVMLTYIKSVLSRTTYLTKD